MHKLVMKFETLDELKKVTARLNAPDGVFSCSNRLQLLKEVRDLYRASFARGDEPSLTELKNVIWKFVS
jgi:hypothetical protein